MKHFKLFVSLMVLVTTGVLGQDCALGMGGSDPEQIVEVFELDDFQQDRMQFWIEALEKENAPLQQQLDSLLSTHPQETPEELTALGQKYEEIKERMVGNSLRYDQLLLGIFRPGQYRKYEALCEEVGQFPLEPTSPAMLKEKEN